MVDHPMLNSSDVTLYYFLELYKDYIKYNNSHLWEYCFRVSGTKKEVREWKITGEDAKCYVDTVGKNAEKIQEYIQNQLKEDSKYD